MCMQSCDTSCDHYVHTVSSVMVQEQFDKLEIGRRGRGVWLRAGLAAYLSYEIDFASIVSFHSLTIHPRVILAI